MSMQSLLEAFKLIEEKKEISDFEAIDDEGIIMEAEEKLGINFPKTYRLFLMKYGCGGVGSSQIYGIPKQGIEAWGVPNGIWLTLDERKKWSYPKHLIIVSDTGDGFWYALDSSKPNKDGEYPVVVYNPDAVEDNYKYELINEDFGDFLLEETRKYLIIYEMNSEENNN